MVDVYDVERVAFQEKVRWEQWISSLVNPPDEERPGEFLRIGITPNGQWILLREVSSRRGTPLRQLRACSPEHSDDLETLKQQGKITFEVFEGPGCEVVALEQI